MAGPMVEFTENGRNKLAKFVGITHWICILPSFFCLLTALYIQILIEDKISFIENYNGAIVPGSLVFAGFFGFFAHILCGKVAFSNRKPEKREQWMAFLLPALIATMVIFLSEFVSGIMCFVHIRELEESFDEGIKVAMAAYKNDATTKEEMDLLQMTYECCGSKSYTDWFYMTWIHPDYVNPMRATSNHADSGESIVNDDVPFSCCSPHVLRPCIHHHVHDNDLHFNYDYRTNTTLNNVGCTNRLMAFYENSVLTVAGATVLGLSFIQIVLSVTFRFLQTSVTSVMSSTDQEGTSTGYLFSGPQKTSGHDTTVTSTEADTLIDTTTEITFNRDDDEFDDELYVSIDEPGTEPMYENIPPFNPEYVLPPENEDENIYNEGEVEEYLAMKFASSKEKFEPISYYDSIPPPPPAPPYPGVEPIYMNTNQSTNRTMHGSRPSLTKVRSDYGSYMAMNMSNSSWSPCLYQSTLKVPKRRHKHHKGSNVREHIMPSPADQSSSPRDTYVINMAQKHSPKHERSFMGHRHLIPERRKLLETNYRDRSPIRMKSPRNKVCHHVQLSRSNEPPIISPQRMSPDRRTTQLHISPVMSASFGNRRSPKKGRSPKRRVSPQKTSFRTGVSYECSHAYD